MRTDNTGIRAKSFATNSLADKGPAPLGSLDGVTLGKLLGSKNSTVIEIGPSKLNAEIGELLSVSKESFDSELFKEIKTRYIQKVVEGESSHYTTLLEAYTSHPDANLEWIKGEITKGVHYGNQREVFESLLRGYLKNPKRDIDFIKDFMKQSERTLSLDESQPTKPIVIQKKHLSGGFNQKITPRMMNLARFYPDSILGQLMKKAA